MARAPAVIAISEDAAASTDPAMVDGRLLTEKTCCKVDEDCKLSATVPFLSWEWISAWYK
jgi:hypothetical protein